MGERCCYYNNYKKTKERKNNRCEFCFLEEVGFFFVCVCCPAESLSPAVSRKGEKEKGADQSWREGGMLWYVDYTG